MPISSNASYVPINITASTLIKTGIGVIGRFVVSSTTAGTVTIYNNTTGSGTKILDTITPAAAQVITLDAAFDIGCFVVITGTISLTVMYV